MANDQSIGETRRRRSRKRRRNDVTVNVPAEFTESHTNQEGVIPETRLDSCTPEITPVASGATTTIVWTPQNVQNDLNESISFPTCSDDGNALHIDEEPHHPNDVIEGTKEVSRGQSTNSGLDHWQKLLPILLVNGTVKLTRTQYELVGSLCNFFNNNGTKGWCTYRSPERDEQSPVIPVANDDVKRMSVFPSFSTLQRLRKALMCKLVVRSVDHSLRINSRAAGVLPRHFDATTQSNSSTAGAVKVRVVPVSEYARMDISCGPVFRHIVSTSLMSYRNTLGDDPQAIYTCFSDCVDTWPLISNRQYFYGCSSPIGVDLDENGTDGLAFNSVEDGDIVTINALINGELQSDIIQFFPEFETQDTCSGNYIGYCRSKTFSGTISASWCASHSSACRPNTVRTSDLSAQEKAIITSFRVNEVNGIREKAYCKLGDRFTLLRPTRNSPVLTRIVLVNRFFVEEGESHCFFMWLYCSEDQFMQDNQPASEWVSKMLRSPTTSSCNGPHVAPIAAIRVKKKRISNARSSFIHPVSSIGTLSCGTKYVIYRFMLFWDGFRVTEGKNASGTGIYMVCLNVPKAKRNGTNAIEMK